MLAVLDQHLKRWHLWAINALAVTWFVGITIASQIALPDVALFRCPVGFCAGGYSPDDLRATLTSIGEEGRDFLHDTLLPLDLVLPALLALPCLPVRGEADGRLSRAFVADPESDEQEARDDDARDSEGATDDREDKEAADDDQDGDDKEGESADDDDGEAEHDTPMKFEDLPEAVQKTLKRESAGGEIEELEKEVKGDRVIYCADVEYETDEGELLYDIEIAENGTLLFKILDDEGDDAPDDDGEGNEKPK